jgi:hypothetical protein
VSRTIRSSTGGTKYLSAVVTETTGKTITSDTFQVALTLEGANPVTWQSPDVTQTVTTSSVRVKLLVGATGTLNPAAGAYYLWVKVTDTPEIEPIRIDERITIA